jgi:hypothetical protein
MIAVCRTTPITLRVPTWQSTQPEEKRTNG